MTTSRSSSGVTVQASFASGAPGASLCNATSTPLSLNIWIPLNIALLMANFHRAWLSTLTNRFPTRISFAMKKFVKGNHRSNVREDEVVRQRQEAIADTDLLKCPGSEGAQVRSELGNEHRQINSRLGRQDAR